MRHGRWQGAAASSSGRWISSFSLLRERDEKERNTPAGGTSGASKKGLGEEKKVKQFECFLLSGGLRSGGGGPPVRSAMPAAVCKRDGKRRRRFTYSTDLSRCFLWRTVNCCLKLIGRHSLGVIWCQLWKSCWSSRWMWHHGDKYATPSHADVNVDHSR